MKKFLTQKVKKFPVTFLTISLLGFSFVALFSSPTLGNIVYYNFADYDDYKKFPSRPLVASKNPFFFKEGQRDWKLPPRLALGVKNESDLNHLLTKSETLAFLIIKDDRILYENYINGHSRKSRSISFSLAKSFLSALVGNAIQEGHIRSLDQPVTDFVPELKGKPFTNFSLKHIIQMTTGMDYTERALINNPFGLHARLYYTPFLEQEILSLSFKGKPGKQFQYKSGESALMGLVLQRALKGKSIADYMQDKIWDPIGMESDGLVNIDHSGNGLEKMWCCIGATARDFAKFGRLYLKKGNWNGRQVVPREWVERSTKKDTSDGSSPEYQYGWWIPPGDSGIFQAEGLYGQYIHINPKTNTLVVRLGKSRGHLTRKEWIELFTSLSSQV